MELKKAVGVCLISLFSATLVVLIARALDNQAASRLEPQLTRIGEALENIRQSGGVAASPGVAAATPAIDDGLVVYYFHGNVRCATCRSIESQAYDTVCTDFALRLDSGEIVWKMLNYEDPANAALAEKFEVNVPVVVLASMKGGQIADWRRLDNVWPLVGDRPAFHDYVRDEIRQMLGPTETSAAAPDAAADIPVPASPPPDIPVPSAGPDAAVPEPAGTDLPVPAAPSEGSTAQ